MERAVILAHGGLLKFDLPDLPDALQRSGSKVSGPNGAAELLGMKPTTLASSIKALGIQK